MPEPIKAVACSIDTAKGSLTIRLVFDDAQGVRQQAEFTYASDKALRFIDELKRQHALGEHRTFMAEADEKREAERELLIAKRKNGGPDVGTDTP